MDVRNRARSPPLVVCFLPVGGNLLRVTEHFEALGLLLDAVHHPIKVGCFAVGRKDIGVEVVAHATLENRGVSSKMGGRSGRTGTNCAHDSEENQAEIESLLGRSACLL